MTNLVQGQTFEGKYKEQMPLLIEQGFQPYTSKDVMQRRVEALQGNDQDETNFWLNQGWDTADGLAYHEGNLIIVTDSELLRNISPDSNINNGSLLLTQEQYQELSKKHEPIRRDKVILGESLNMKHAKEHDLWINLAQGDRVLLNEYVNLIFAKNYEIYGDTKGMGFRSLLYDQKVPLMRAWCLGFLSYGSDAYDGGYYLDGSGVVRLFGRHTKSLEVRSH